MIQRKLWLFALALLLVSVGIVAAQSSTNFATQRFVMVGGGSATSTNYAVTSVFGQPATDEASSAHYKVSGGFLQPHRSAFTGKQLWLPLIQR